MEIGITDVVRKQLRWSPMKASELTDLFYCWDVNHVDIGNGRHLLLIANSSNRFCAITRMTAASWKNFEQFVIDAITGALYEADLSSNFIQTYFRLAGAPRFSKTHGPKPMGGVSDLAMCLWGCEPDMTELLQRDLILDYNCTFICHCATRNDFIIPVEAFEEDLMRRE